MLAGFGLNGRPTRLAGGEGVSWLVGDVVVKQALDVSETEWTQALLHRVEARGVRIAEPVAALDRRWVHAGWAASRFVPGLRSAAPDWTLISDAGLRFCAAAELVRDGGEDVLRQRTHRWAIADRVAWAEQRVDLDTEPAEVFEAISRFLTTPSGEEHFVHGDLSGNVFLDPGNSPVILDVSPYLRPPRWAAAIVFADAVLWNGAPLDRARRFVTTDVERDLLARALLFRMIAEQLADDPRHGALLEPYRRALTVFE